jgi:chromosome segregation ATPase
MIEEYDKTKEEVTNKLEKQVEEITKKQNDTLQEIEDAKRKAREAEMKYRGGDLSIKELEKARNKTMTLNGEYSRRKERLDETKKRLKGLKDGNTDIIDTIPDMRRAESRKTNGRLFRLGAEANIERSKDILLVDGKIATNGLLVNIRQAIREALNGYTVKKHRQAP